MTNLSDTLAALSEVQMEELRFWAENTPSFPGPEVLALIARTGQLVPVPSVERVARALCESDGYDPDEDVIGGQAAGFQNFGPRWQADVLGLTDYKALATAVIAAMKE